MRSFTVLRRSSDIVAGRILVVAGGLPNRHSGEHNLFPVKSRLDQLLVARGLYDSREKAQRGIMAGDVSINGQVVDKAGTKIADDAVIVVKAPERYVGRGGLKMEGALGQFGLDPTGWTCLDIGASTGGFTDCLLQHGAV